MTKLVLEVEQVYASLNELQFNDAGSRELDHEINRVIDPIKCSSVHDVPNYTTSLDAVLKLCNSLNYSLLVALEEIDIYQITSLTISKIACSALRSLIGYHLEFI
jgi:hypothetical protein